MNLSSSIHIYVGICLYVKKSREWNLLTKYMCAAHVCGTL